MGRAPCCDKANVKKGPWSPEEDAKLKEYIEKNGTGGNWIALPHKADLRRCGKSCRLRWLNYLRPNIKHGEFSDDEDRIICSLFASIGSRWSIIAAQLPGRTDNDIKNYWNTKLKKKLFGLAAPIPTQHQKLGHHNQASITTPFSSNNSLLQNPSMESPYSSLQSSSAYECGYYSTPVLKAFSRGFEAISPSLTPVICSNSSIPSVMIQAQEDIGYASLMQGDDYNKFKGCNNDKINSNLLMFGGEASCSSSDGSSSGEHLGMQSYFNNGIDENQKFLINNCADGYVGDHEKEDQSGCFSENPMDYSIEEIKQLISTNSICNNNLNFFVDEIIKTEEKVYRTTDIFDSGCT